MMVNFLSWTGGTWMPILRPRSMLPPSSVQRAPPSLFSPWLPLALRAVHPMALPTVSLCCRRRAAAAGAAAGGAATGSVGTILERIHVQRLKDFAATKAVPGISQRDLDIALSLHLAPPLINFPERLQRHASRGLPGVMAEMKRASPSKGDIDPTAHAGVRRLHMHEAAPASSACSPSPSGSRAPSTISLARRAVDNMPIARHPEKDFIVDTYQIAEARLAGATLFCSSWPCSPTNISGSSTTTVSAWAWEPLVEVNNPEEMTRAIRLGAKVVRCQQPQLA